MGINSPGLTNPKMNLGLTSPKMNLGLTILTSLYYVLESNALIFFTVCTLGILIYLEDIDYKAIILSHLPKTKI